MEPYEEKELEESLEWMRKQFQVLTDEIKIPDSLRADILKKQLELMEAEEMQKQAPARPPSPKIRRPKSIVFPRRMAAGLAACAVIAGTSLLSYRLGRNNGEKLAALENTSGAPPSSTEEITEDAAYDETAVLPLENDDAGVPEPAAMSEAAAAPQAQEPEAFSEENDTAPRMLQAPAEAGPPVGLGTGMSGSAGNPPNSSLKKESALAAEDIEASPWASYLPEALPEDLMEAGLFEDQESLSVSYLSSDYSRQIQLTLRNDSQQIPVPIDPSQPETYDLRLYPQPYTDSVPEELAAQVNDPVFRFEDITLSLVESRVFDPNEGSQYRGNFRILFPDGVVAGLNVTGVSPEEIYEIIRQMAPAE